jgi:sporulation protein YlmC with PRC-barrel domain
MSETAEFSIGSEVTCSEGVCGDLRRVVVDPVARALTHLVVEPRHGRGAGHLVPVDLVASTTGGIQLHCTKSEFAALPDAEEKQFLPGASGEWGYGQEQMLSLPRFGIRLGVPGGLGVVGTRGGIEPSARPQVTTSDRVPAGEVEVRRGEHVHATDGTIGRVQGLVIDPRDHQVTHVLLDEGHLWGQKRVAIPISAVTGVEDGVRLNLSKDEVRDLPAVDLDQPE